ncbi:hypothetical protein J1614_011431 [Plenodomus biglobosus]|nr:hypothetical protein J1614_011431 [Plenodomus biglobosus]
MSHHNETENLESDKDRAQTTGGAKDDPDASTSAPRVIVNSRKTSAKDLPLGPMGGQNRAHAISMLSSWRNTGTAAPSFDGPSDDHNVGGGSSTGHHSVALGSSSPATASAAGISAFLATGPINISIADEREATNANPNHPGFLRGVVFNPANEGEWFTLVLPHISTLTFVIASSADIAFAGPIFASPELPQIHQAITKLSFPGFHWFSGISEDRRHNPFLQLAATLPNVTEIALTMHTAGITTSCWTETQQLDLESIDLARSQERKVLPLSDVLARYNYQAMFRCNSVRRIRLEYLESQLVAQFCVTGRPLDLLRALRTYLVHGFSSLGKAVEVFIAKKA